MDEEYDDQEDDEYGDYYGDYDDEYGEESEEEEDSGSESKSSGSGSGSNRSSLEDDSKEDDNSSERKSEDKEEEQKAEAEPEVVAQAEPEQEIKPKEDIQSKAETESTSASVIKPKAEPPKKKTTAKNKGKGKVQTYAIPVISKPPIFESKLQLINFFSQEDICKLRPLGKIVGIGIPPKPVVQAPVEVKPDTENKEPEKNVFWDMAGYKDDGKLLPLELPDELPPPFYTPPSQILRTLIHTGIMRRVRMSKEKSEYRQIIYPNPTTSVSPFIPSFFGTVLPSKFMVSDKSIKELEEV